MQPIGKAMFGLCASYSCEMIFLVVGRGLIDGHGINGAR